MLSRKLTIAAALSSCLLTSVNAYASCDFTGVAASLHGATDLLVEQPAVRCDVAPAAFTVNVATDGPTFVDGRLIALLLIYRSGPAPIFVEWSTDPVSTSQAIIALAAGAALVPLTFPTSGEYVLEVRTSLGDASATIAVRVGNVCSVHVSPQSQLDPRWNLPDQFYDHSTRQIASRGCGLTALSMALTFAKVETDPGSLNSLMIANDVLGRANYVPDKDDPATADNVNWDAATRDASGSSLKFDTFGGSKDSIDASQAAYNTLDHFLCAADPHPIIVGVRSLTKPEVYPGHFVLVTGRQERMGSLPSDPPERRYRYSIIDPSEHGSSLDDYVQPGGIYPEFETRGAVKDPPGDISGLDFAVGAGANLALVDPLGRRTGFSTETGETVQEIPNSAYFVDALGDDVIVADAIRQSHAIQIFTPMNGSYSVVVTGKALETYTLSIRSFDQSGTAALPILINGIAEPQSHTAFQLTFSPVTGIANVSVAATFESTLNDIRTSRQLALIANDGIANSLTAKVNAAADASKRRGNAANHILAAFVAEVEAQADHQINVLARAVLIRDAESLLSQYR